VHSDDGEDVGVLGFERAQLVQHVEAVDAAERPEVDDEKATSESGE
jgi:hypothetical protein